MVAITWHQSVPTLKLTYTGLQYASPEQPSTHRRDTVVEQTYSKSAPINVPTVHGILAGIGERVRYQF
jgi:hypothetical protein